MNFSSFEFWKSLLLLLLIAYSVRTLAGRLGLKSFKLFDSLALAIVSSALLVSESRITFIVFLYVIAVSWFGGKYALSERHAKHRRLLLGALFTLQLLPLLFFKYFSFFASVFGYSYHYYEGYIIPVGISFYTFQLMGYAIDMSRNLGSTASLKDEYNFACFFPQIVAGPIERKEHLLPQIKAFSFALRFEDLAPGLKMIIAGLFYKIVIGDNLAGFSNWCTNATFNSYEIWTGTFLFGLRIYFDFSGYSMVAVGLGRLFGIQLTQNFHSPYTALNIRDFWGRWHRTLSSWFRDYLYIPLGGGRSHWWWVNTLVVFVISGIWHGAGWNFIIWGLFHGLMLVVYKLVSPRIKWHRSVSYVITMICVVISWLFFYETNTRQLLHKISVLFTPAGYALENIKAIIPVFGTGLDLVAAFILSFVAVLVIFFEYIGLKKNDDPYWIWGNHTVCCFAVIIIYLFANPGSNGFIYFNF